MPETVQQCPCCGVSTHRASPHARVRGWSYVRCARCTLVFLNPRPTSQELQSFYSGTYKYDHQAYRRTVLRQGPLLDLLERFTPPTGRLLEVGCSYGYFLDAAKRRGWTVGGVEMNREAAESASRGLGIPVLGSTLDEACRTGLGTYDVVVAWHLLEHVAEPLGFLRSVREVLAPNGILALRVPNLESAVARLAGTCWQWLSPPEHIYMFSIHTLRKLLTDSGFSVLHEATMRGNAHGLLFEMLRARTKSFLCLLRIRRESDTPTLRSPAVYENRRWYRAAEVLVAIGSAPVDRLLSGWLARSRREAELLMIGQREVHAVGSAAPVGERGA